MKQQKRGRAEVLKDETQEGAVTAFTRGAAELVKELIGTGRPLHSYDS